MKKESYFKRIKKPVSSPQEAEPIRKETRTYLLISLGVMIVTGVLSGLLGSDSVLGTILTIVGLIGMAGVIYFGIMLYAMKRVLKRMKNLTCDKCGADLRNAEYTFRELSRRIKIRQVQNHPDERITYVNVQITCKCPKCAAPKTFGETLCLGSEQRGIRPLDVTVEDYMHGMIHA